MPGRLIDVTLVSDTSILADGDVICATAEIPLAVGGPGWGSLLESIQLFDMDDQGVALDLVFLRSNVSLGTVNGAPNISDTNAFEMLGRVNIATTDYVDYTGCKVATIRNVGLMLSALAGQSAYVGAITRGGTPTYTASGLRLRLGVVQ
jgi:hypothetical protein